MKKISLVFILWMTQLLFVPVFGQSVAINNDGSAAHSSAMLDVKSTNKGLLIPRMTSAQRKAIANPAEGLMVFDIEKKSLFYYDGRQWLGMQFSKPAHLPPAESGISTPQSGALLGSTVKISGNYAAVAAQSEDINGKTNVGAVYIFKWENNNWVQKHRITAPDGEQSDNFGYAMDMEGDFLVIGAPNKTINGVIGRGKFYIFRRVTDTNWVLEHSVARTAGDAQQYMGRSVAISTTTSNGVSVAVGSPNQVNVSGVKTGIVLVYRRNASNGTWALSKSFSGSDSREGDRFGYSVDIEGNTLIAGAPWHDYLPNSNLYREIGAGYFFQLNTATTQWDQVYKQMNNFGATQDSRGQMGISCALSGNLALFGIPYVDQNYQPMIWVVQKNGAGNWGSASVIRPPLNNISSEISTYGRFGTMISLKGNYLIVSECGAMMSEQGSFYTGGAQPGKALIFRHAGEGKFEFVAAQEASNPQSEDKFGISVDITSDGRYLIGQPFNKSYDIWASPGTFFYGQVE